METSIEILAYGHSPERLMSNGLSDNAVQTCFVQLKYYFRGDAGNGNRTDRVKGNISHLIIAFQGFSRNEISFVVLRMFPGGSNT